MHAHCELIMPPVDDVPEMVERILRPFQEEYEAEDAMPDQFWDWYVIGGRWAGAKLRAALDSEKLDWFEDELRRREVTCHGLQAGKQELSPSSQIEMVDALWHETFPDAPEGPCPLFAHSNDQYARQGPLSGTLPDDVCMVSALPPRLEASRVIIARYENWAGGNGPLVAEFMTADQYWNGCNFDKTQWDGRVLSAVEAYRARLGNMRDTFRAACDVKDDWLSITVDYHH